MMIETVGLGGAEMVVLQLTQELRRRGHTVVPVVPHGREGWLLDRFRDAGIQWRTYVHRRALAPGLPRQLARLIASIGADVVHSHEFAMAVYGAAAARKARVPHIITWHANQVMTALLRRRIALRWAFRRSGATVAVSEDTRRHLESKLGRGAGPIVVIPNGIIVRHGERESTRRALGVRPDEILLLGVGTLMPRKGFANLIRALKSLHAANTAQRWRLVIAGKGEQRAELEALVRECGLGDRITLLGPRNDIPDLQAAADIFVMPSLWEGLPLAILEAMFAGNAIVASNISGIPEAIQHERHGLLVPPGDEGALSAAITRVMTDRAYAARLGEAAKNRANEKFTIATMANLYERLYRGERFASAQPLDG
jgi:glycosyltransferase involved in cell wall biosynthesis